MTVFRAVAAVLIALAVAHQDRAWPTVYNVYAIRYATLADFPVSSLVAGADPARRADIAMMFWLLEADDGATVLFDAGFYNESYIERWRPRNYVRPDRALASLGIRLHDVTDIVVSHVHWDHMDGSGLFPGATIWLQMEEYEYYVDADGRPRNRGIDQLGAALLDRARRDGRLRLVDGDAIEIFPGITVYTGGRHTYASQYISARTSRGTIVLASDNLYLYENLDRGAAIAQTFDADANRRSHRRMLELVSDPRQVVPGHDPLVFDRFPRVSDNVVAIPR
ncbi:MAG TPA: N-acyl homoserine lactonase family protein [Vicinamibacterales bacterium]|nr:N-acyl homoserine lactonase family protein [Vicinamibacterales bacterium]